MLIMYPSVCFEIAFFCLFFPLPLLSSASSSEAQERSSPRKGSIRADNPKGAFGKGAGGTCGAPGSAPLGRPRGAPVGHLGGSSWRGTRGSNSSGDTDKEGSRATRARQLAPHRVGLRGGKGRRQRPCLHSTALAA